MAQILRSLRSIRGQSSKARANEGAPLSLRNKLLLFAAALVLVPGLILVLIAERSGRESLERVIGHQLAREAGHTAERLSARLRSERETLANFARQDLMREVRVADIDKRVSMALATLRNGSPARVDYLVVDASRRVVAASAAGLIGALPAWADLRWATERGAPRVLGPTATAPGDPARLVMTTPIRDPDDPQRDLGTLVGLFDWERLTAATGRVREDLAAQGVAADVLVSRPNGAVIGGSRSSAAGDAVRLADLSGVARGVPDERPDYTVDESAGLIIGRAALASDLPDWKLLVVELRAHALAPARRLSGRLALTMGLALIAALAIATFEARRVVQPLSELTHAIRGLSLGEAGHLRVPVRTQDEVGTLAVAFNEMASELGRAQRDLVEAEKFAFVGQLAAGIAHEIRTALGVLGSSAQILERSLPEDAGAEAAELAQMIRAEVARLSDVANDLLTLGRARPLELEATPISDPLFRAVDFVGPKARDKGIRIDRSAPPGEPAVWCDPELMYQVAVNLLVNAIQALAAGGRIEARVLAVKDGTGGFEVWDDGPGIPEAIRERIFQPFVTARDGGVGLGLTFVKRVVHDHRGLVTLESEPASGTRIGVRLPLAEARS
jgi:signal transduction histidine kinase